jgi:hypothetical protein
MVDDFSFNDMSSRTLEVTYPGIKGQKIVVALMPLTTLAMVLFLGYYALVLYKDDATFQTVYLLMIFFFVFGDILFFLFFHSLFGRNWKRVEFSDSGVRFPRFLWDRLRGREEFLAKSKISSVRASIITSPNVVGTDNGEFIISTSSGKLYRTGFRAKADIFSTAQWIETTWQMKVEIADSRGGPISVAQTAPAAVRSQPKVCRGCGYVFLDDLNFCPSCGRMADNEKDVVEMFSSGGPAERPSAVIAQVSASKYQDGTDHQDHYVQWQPRPSNEGAQGQVQSNPYTQYQDHPNPVPQNIYYQGQYYGQQGQAPPGPATGQRESQYRSYDPSAKDPRLATILAAFLGLLGFLGVGHLYMRKPVKGIILLFVGGFLALFSVVSILNIFQPSEFSISVRLATAAMLSAPFLALYLWQVFDAAKPKRTGATLDQYGNGRPPYRP